MAISIPERAIRNFEQVHGLAVTLHDLAGHLRGRVDGQRLSHRHRACRPAKAQHPEACIHFDVDLTRNLLDRYPTGLVQRCPFAIREAVVPCFRNTSLQWLLFAGPLGAADTQRDAVILEGLRQLAARLRLWEDEHPHWPGGGRVERGGAGQPDSRKGAIQRWIANYHTEAIGLDDLALALGLSRFQTSRAVRKACGQSFQHLILEARLNTAQSLLQETDLDVLEVALRSGFGDRSHFHRCFRNALGTSPQAWRRRAPQQA